MQIALVITQLKNGGMERVAVTLTNEFAKQGHQCFLVSSTKHPVCYDISEEVVFKDFYKKSKYSILSKIKGTLNILRILKEIKPDVAIGFYFPVCLLSLGLKIPTIQSEHTNYFRKGLSLGFNFRRFYINRLATRTTVLTQTDYDFIKKKMSNVVIMPNPISIPDYTYNSNDREKIILAVGRMNSWQVKGIDRLLHVWSLIAHKYPDWKLRIVGSGSEENFSYLKSLAEEKNTTNSVIWAGYIKDMEAEYKTASIYTLTSRNEGFPMGLSEAMSYGCACVSFDIHTGPSVIINDGEDGYLIADGNTEAMAETIGKLIEDQELRETLGKRAMENMKRFSTEKIVDKWEQLFKEITTK
jgi:glycosyltransferase involved in cell wall biosynthesis